MSKELVLLSKFAAVPAPVLRIAYKRGFTDETKKTVLLQSKLEWLANQRAKELKRSQ